MEARQLLEALHVAERLKDETRHCTTTKGAPENVASHSWRMALMAYFMTDEFPELDMNKVTNVPDSRSGRVLHGRYSDISQDAGGRGPGSVASVKLGSEPSGSVCIGHDGALRGDGRTGDAGSKAL